MTGLGNALLEEFARNQSTGARGSGNVLYLNRSAATAAPPKLDESPSFHFHPYGALTDVHVQLGLLALQHKAERENVHCHAHKGESVTTKWILKQKRLDITHNPQTACSSFRCISLFSETSQQETCFF